MAQTTTSVGLRQGKEGTQKSHAPCLPPQRRGFPLTGWRSLDTAPFERAMAGPRCKRPRVQSMDHPLLPIRWRPQGGLKAPRHQPPNAIRAEAWLTTYAAEGCGKAAPTALGLSPVLAQQAVLQFSLIHSLPHCHRAQLPSGGAPTATGDKRLLLLLLHASALGARARAGTAAYPLILRGHHHTDF